MRDNLAFLEALQQIAKDKGISVDVLLDALANALVAAYKRMPGAAEEAVVTIEPDSGEIRVYGQELDEEGAVVREWDDTPKDFGRIAAQTAKQVIFQRLREAERDLKYEEYAGREGDIVTGIIQQSDNRYTLLDLGKVEALLPQAEQVPFEHYEHNARLKAYIVEVRKTSKGPQIVVSRTHPGLIKRLFELEVPEIANGIVEIKAAAREPGHRTKIAVWSNDPNVDPVGACVGRPGRPGPHGHHRAARREGRHRPLLRGPPGVRDASPAAGQGQRRRAGRGVGDGDGHRQRLPAVPGHRQGRPERPLGRPADGLAHRHQEREPAGRGGGLRRPGMGRGRVGAKRGRRDGLAARRGRRGALGRGVGGRFGWAGRRGRRSCGRPPSAGAASAGRRAAEAPVRADAAAGDAAPVAPCRGRAPAQVSPVPSRRLGRALTGEGVG